MKKIVINPVQRVHASSAVEVTVENNKVVDARCSGVFFRGFELIMQGRDPRDASYLTMRICGICASTHGLAAALALEDAAGVQPPRNGNLLRNLIVGADILQNHIRHFYLFSFPDYVQGPKLGPFTPCFKKVYRLPPKTNDALLQHYFQSIEISRLTHELITLLGGKAPFPHGILAGGSTVPPGADILMDFSAKLKRVNDFIKNIMLSDLYVLAEAYPDYYKIGCRRANFLEFGLFRSGKFDGTFFPGAAVIDGKIQKLDSSVIKEHLSYSWYVQSEPTHPTEGQTRPNREKEEAYSWVKAPRYEGHSLEGGPLARLWIKGYYQKGISTMDRIAARVLEAKKTGELMEGWLKQLEPGQPVFTSFEIPREAEGVGLTGAMRGPLGHWIRIQKGRIAHYQIITPTSWNFSPRDDTGQMGPVEEALIGTPIEDENEPVEIGRVIRAFDICSSCSAHVIIPGSPVKEMVILP